jgi:hypothetical protein
VRARDVAGKAVADHDRVVRCAVECRERRFEDARIGFSGADLRRDDRDFEERRERCERQLLALHVGRTVGHEPETVIAREIPHHRIGVGIDELNDAAAGAECAHGRVDETVIAHAGGAEGSAPDLAAEVRDERA